MGNKNEGLIPFVTGLLLIAAALGLVIYNVQEDQQAMEGRNAVLSQLQELGAAAAPSGEVSYPDYLLDPYMEMPVQNIDGYDYIGVLSLPVLELELPVMSQWDYPRLKVNPCRYTGSAYLDNLVICAHNYSSHFGRIGALSIGDEVYFTDMDGNLFLYRVAEITTLQPMAVEEMTDSGWALTLFTCTVGGQTRVTVRCERVEE